MPPPNPHLHRTIMEVVETQIQTNDPPEARQAFDRLLASGIEEGEVRRLIGAALVLEMWHMMKNKEVYNHARHAGYLNRLPQEPTEQE